MTARNARRRTMRGAPRKVSMNPRPRDARIVQLRFISQGREGTARCRHRSSCTATEVSPP